MSRVVRKGLAGLFTAPRIFLFSLVEFHAGGEWRHCSVQLASAGGNPIAYTP